MGTRCGEAMAQKSLETMLLDLGMNKREVKLYIAMLNRDESTAPELHRLSGLIRTKTYETLEQMVAHGYCFERVSGRRKYFRAVPPDQLRTVIQHQLELDYHSKTADVTLAFAELSERYRKRSDQHQSLNAFEVIRNSDQLQLRYNALLNETEKEILAFSRTPFLGLANPAIDREIQRIFKDRLSHGVEARTVYMYDAKIWGWLEREIIRTSIAEGESARVNSSLPVKMYIFDRRNLIFGIPSIPGVESNDMSMVLISDPGFISANVLLFDYVWNDSTPYESWSAPTSPTREKTPTTSSGLTL